ncbi:ABC transporter permease [Phytohabitans suffuscus]|uniref:Amino acid ABC transporter permease n=1 Tax=Phytohabitans suffuscus TaxID=624315 RepID=A0A6F8YUT9_9ACTN|nr:ABC transporter permease subunit [Phytohabitans suffuscus]BCB89907.1 amino acid ABC transporter permease [Phytohabitans suffuscus]
MNIRSVVESPDARTTTRAPAAAAPAGTGAPRTARGRIRSWLTAEATVWRIIGLVAGAAIWEIYSRIQDDLLVPSFLDTITTAFEMLDERELWDAMWLSNQAMVLGFALSVAIGLPAGLLLGRSRWAARFGNVYVSILLVGPTAALIPLLIMWTGVGLLSRVIMVTAIAVPYLVVSCRAGVMNVGPSLIDMGRSFGARELTLWRLILLRAALPQIMTGIRICLGRAIEGMILVELIMVSVGLGLLVLEYSSIFEPERLYAVVVFVVVESVILAYLSRWLERRATPWMRRGGGA